MPNPSTPKKSPPQASASSRALFYQYLYLGLVALTHFLDDEPQHIAHRERQKHERESNTRGNQQNNPASRTAPQSNPASKSPSHESKPGRDSHAASRRSARYTYPPPPHSHDPSSTHRSAAWATMRSVTPRKKVHWGRVRTFEFECESESEGGGGDERVGGDEKVRLDAVGKERQRGSEREVFGAVREGDVWGAVGDVGIWGPRPEGEW